jgi:ATP-dependent helicase/nuclease subunit A
MGKGTLTIYSASAGSGKTYKLTGIYLTALFKSRFNYRKILAVTFTNKATAEMKARILDNLNYLATGAHSDYLPELIKDTGFTEEIIRVEAGEILNSVLHDFSRFSVCTIDSFFQKILRAFTKEAGLHSGYNVELDHSIILSAAVDELIASASSDDQLRKWLTTYAKANLEEEKSCNLKTGIIRLAEELFKEKFKILSSNQRDDIGNKQFLLEYIKQMQSLRSSFEKQMDSYGRKAYEIFTEYDLSDDMFYQKGKGVPGYIRSLLSGVIKVPNSYIREIEKEPPRWSTGVIPAPVQNAISHGLGRILKESLRFCDENITGYKSAQVILANIYSLGILSDVLHNVRLITSSENSFLLSDAGEVLNLITAQDQCPFIYEKVGTRYENYMIDEFQDTSIIQWNNFKPLIENTMAEGFDNLVVGDVKQSIYRWRNSDWKILGKTLTDLVDNTRYISNSLTTNWRSRSNIIKFNNRLFDVIPDQADDRFACDHLPDSFKRLYSEAVQVDPGKKAGGYVRLDFLEDEKDPKWEETVLERLPGVIESFQDRGYCASDIGILVRNGKEGACVLQKLIDYSNNCLPEKKHYNYNVVSDDSLLLSNSHAVNFIIAVLAVVNNPDDMISRAMMLRFFLLAKGDEDADKASLVSNRLIKESELYFPPDYEGLIGSLNQMPLFEATENIIKFFGIGEFSRNVAYLNTFQDYILGFSASSKADIQSFLDWWESTGIRKSVVLPGNQNAMRILTIHKAKGLEFKIVILPFLSWDLDHPPSKQTILWVRPSEPPFNALDIVPVKYSKELEGTIFAEDYKSEKYSVFIDNINLLYVALTRAKDAIYGFSVNAKSENSVAAILKNAIMADTVPDQETSFSLSSYFKKEESVFEFGEIPLNKSQPPDNNFLTSSVYRVSRKMGSLKLKLHGENYFSSDQTEIREKINYGKLMHEIFEGITTSEDISGAVRKLVLEGKLPEEQSDEIEMRIHGLINTPEVSEWFMQGNEIMKEAGILLPSGVTRRPDRIILRNGKTIIIDFKFGEENHCYANQVDQYRRLLTDMGYDSIDAFIWYVDKNKIVTV